MKTKLCRYLKNLGACAPALNWIDADSLNNSQIAWNTCPDASWLFWVVAKHLGKPGWPTYQEIVLAACDCAEAVLHLIPDGEYRPRIAIYTARLWAGGWATTEECEEAADAAYQAALDNAHVTYTVYAADAAFYAADAACFAVYDSGYYASRAAYSAVRAIWRFGGNFRKAHADVVDIVRKRLYIGEVAL